MILNQINWHSTLIYVYILGPVPTFFSNTPAESLEELKKNPSFAFQCLQALVSRLLARGDLSRQVNLMILSN